MQLSTITGAIKGTYRQKLYNVKGFKNPWKEKVVLGTMFQDFEIPLFQVTIQ